MQGLITYEDTVMVVIFHVTECMGNSEVIKSCYTVFV